MHPYLQAYEKHGHHAEDAYRVYKSYCGGNPPPRVPGMDTVIRMAVRIESGSGIAGAAAKEYLYRWKIGIKDFDQCEGDATSIFGVPHTIGM